MKRNLVLATITTFCLSLLLAIFAVNPVSVNAGTASIDKVAGYKSYALSYLVKDAGFTAESDYTYKIGGVAVAKPADDAAKTAQSEAGFYTSDGKSVMFLAKKSYTLEVCDGETVVHTITVNTDGTPADDELKYDYATEDLTAYNEAIASATKITEDGQTRDIAVEDNFKVPSVASLVKDAYYDVDDLKGTLYYAAPGSTSYSSKSISDIDNVEFKVTKVGDYKYYVLLKNDFVSLNTEDLVEENDGWYAKDDDGNAKGSVIIPIFTFSVKESAAPRITVGHNEIAYKNIEYTVNCFTVVATDPSYYYTLYYTAKKDAVPAGSALDEDTLTDLGLKEVTEENGFEEENLFNSSSKSFTPVEGGYYYVVLHVIGHGNEHAYAISDQIDANNEVSKVKYETEFFKNNWVSVVLLSVAVLCFVAIIVILCYKPKETVGLSTKK